MTLLMFCPKHGLDYGTKPARPAERKPCHCRCGAALWTTSTTNRLRRKWPADVREAVERRAA